MSKLADGMAKWQLGSSLAHRVIENARARVHARGIHVCDAFGQVHLTGSPESRVEGCWRIGTVQGLLDC